MGCTVAGTINNLFERRIAMLERADRRDPVVDRTANLLIKGLPAGRSNALSGTTIGHSQHLALGQPADRARLAVLYLDLALH